MQYKDMVLNHEHGERADLFAIGLLGLIKAYEAGYPLESFEATISNVTDDCLDQLNELVESEFIGQIDIKAVQESTDQADVESVERTELWVAVNTQKKKTLRKFVTSANELARSYMGLCQHDPIEAEEIESLRYQQDLYYIFAG